MIKENTALSMAEASEFVDKTSGAEIVAFIRKFSELKVEDAKKMRAKLEVLGNIKLDEKSISKIIDTLPESVEELNKLFFSVGLDEDEVKEIVNIVKEFK
ncbi:MAG TPA: hypothetical protein VJH92_01730 [Candidatus Nanoarchaeia archaeon]|nr:hypothetical protein [Candidatus Nanoarchaeia archaeon]